MGTTVREALVRVDREIWGPTYGGTLGLRIEDVHNIVQLLAKGYGLEDDYEGLLEKYACPECVPVKKNIPRFYKL